MKAAPIDAHPGFPLMKQSDIVSFYHLQMPRWLFSHKKYRALSLESKVAYTFLLNRFQLSRLNGWVNSENEVFVIFTREELAGEMQVGYKKAIACFRELAAASLIWEKRVGRGNANQIYLAAVELSEQDAGSHNAAPFGNGVARPDDSAVQEDGATTAQSSHSTAPDLPKPQFKTCQNGSSRPAVSAHPDLPKPPPSKKEKRDTELRKIEKVSRSVCARESPASEQTDGTDTLSEILERSELWVLPEETQAVFQSAIERLFYTERLKIGGAVLPQSNIRSHLWRLDGMVVQDAFQKLRANTEKKVKNSTAYVMSTLFNCIHEGQSDLLVDPYLNSLSLPPPGKEARLC